jgi:hypothetical protein
VKTVEAWSRAKGLPEHIADGLNAAVHARFCERPQAFCSLADAKKLLLTADYSGEQSDSRYRTVGLLLVNEEDLQPWKARLAAVRAAGLGRRRLSYKALRSDAIRWKALSAFLASAGPLRGYCLAVAFEKNMVPLVGDVADHKGVLAPLSGWPKEVRRKALEVAMVVSVLVMSASPSDADLMLVTDNDAMAAHPQRLEEFVTQINVLLGQLTPKRFGTVTFRTTSIPADNLFVEDLCALPDLAAGALMDFLRSPTARSQEPLQATSSALDERTQVLLDWMLREGSGLTRLAAIVDRSDQPHAGRVRLLRRLA